MPVMIESCVPMALTVCAYSSLLNEVGDPHTLQGGPAAAATATRTTPTAVTTAADIAAADIAAADIAAADIAATSAAATAAPFEIIIQPCHIQLEDIRLPTCTTAHNIAYHRSIIHHSRTRTVYLV